MVVEKRQVEMMVITGADALDEISVVFEDFVESQGRVLIECYGQAWSGFWSAMSGKTIREFFLSCDKDYLANRMFGQMAKHNNQKDREYLARIIKAVQDALRAEPS